MFLEVTLRRNPGLIEAAFAFHRRGVIPPNCFLIDQDAVEANAALLAQAAAGCGLSLYFTTKQVGFNPLLAQAIVRAGVPKAVAVDVREVSALARYGVPIGHVGHLVQIPQQMIEPILGLEPEVITIFSVEKARQISAVASRTGHLARLLLRVTSQDDWVYPGQAGGFALDTLADQVTHIVGLPGVRVVGVTSFPCLLFDETSRTLKPTRNLDTILKAAAILQRECGIAVEQINAPGNTCVGALEMLARLGATHAEPGHALTGTTYLHTEGDQPERPAMVYVSEVSHLSEERACIFGGGIYRRVGARHALVGAEPGQMVRARVLPLDARAIDYYATLALPRGCRPQAGDTVILASRAQAFVSRSYVGVVQGISQGSPSLAGIFDALGRPVERIL